MRKYKNLILTCLACVAIPAGAQDAENSVTGVVVIRDGGRRTGHKGGNR